MMKIKLIDLLEDIKLDKYTSYTDYLDSADVEEIAKWYNTFAVKESINFETIIELIYELYIREDIDLRPYEEYKRLTTYLADKYGFNCEHFLDVYRSFRNLLFS